MKTRTWRRSSARTRTCSAAGFDVGALELVGLLVVVRLAAVTAEELQIHHARAIGAFFTGAGVVNHADIGRLRRFSFADDRAVRL